MTPTTIVRNARADGVVLALSSAETIKVVGEPAAVNRWLAAIRERKGEIIDLLKNSTQCAASALRWWRIHQADGSCTEIACHPDVTHDEILERHAVAVAAEPFTPIVRKPLAPMTVGEAAAVGAWLARIEEIDPATIAEVMDRCQGDAEARDYFIGRAEAEVPLPDRCRRG